MLWECSQKYRTKIVIVVFYRFEYESTDTSREEMKRKFAPTMDFVEEYLNDVVNQNFPFGDTNKNELTLQVRKLRFRFTYKMFCVFIDLLFSTD